MFALFGNLPEKEKAPFTQADIESSVFSRLVFIGLQYMAMNEFENIVKNQEELVEALKNAGADKAH